MAKKNKRLSTWLRSGVIEQNTKDTLKSTLDKLHSICPLKISRSSLRDSLHDNLYMMKPSVKIQLIQKYLIGLRHPLKRLGQLGQLRYADLLCMINFIIENIKLFLKQKKPLFYGRYKANPTELLSNFKKNVRNKMAHGIVVDEKGRWSDHELQHVSVLACEVVSW